MLIVSHDIDVGHSLRNAVVAVADRATPPFSLIETRFISRNPHAVLLLFPSGDVCLREWLWGKIREKKFKNPVLVIGFVKKEDFVASHPIFDKKFGYHGSHCYLSIPFKLEDLTAALLNLQCLEDADLTVILNYFATDKKYIRMILHDVQGAAKPSCNEVCSRFRIARRYFEKNNDSPILKQIDDYILKMQRSPRPFDWKKESFGLAEDIRNLLKK